MVEKLKTYIFTTQGRITRLQYLKYGLAFMLGLAVVSGVLQFAATTVTHEGSMLVRGLEFLTSMAWIFAYISLSIRRLHDLGRPEWWAVGMIIPLVNFLMGIYLLLAPGNQHRNSYGEVPRD